MFAIYFPNDAVNIKGLTFLDVMPYGQMEVYRRFGLLFKPEGRKKCKVLSAWL
jgi:hypothetical protein